jgi:hypothetical protein
MRFLSFFRSAQKSKPASARRSHSFRPQLEQLDERLVPSTLSSAISFPVSQGWILFTERDLYTMDRNTSQAVLFRGTNRYNLGGPSHVFAVSASIDPNTGSSEVFALTSAYENSNYGPLWLCDSNGYWHYFGGYYVDISATRDGHAYAVNLFGASVSYIDSSGTITDVGAPSGGVYYGFGNSVAASVGRYGQNEVFALGGSTGVLYVNSDNAPGQWLLVDNHNFTSLSATANNTVFALSYGTVFQETEHYNFVGKSYYWTSQQISQWVNCWSLSADIDASGHDEVYVIDSTNTAFLYNQGARTTMDYDVSDLAAADDGFFYDVNYYGGSYSGYLWNPNTSGWYYLADKLS